MKRIALLLLVSFFLNLTVSSQMKWRKSDLQVDASISEGRFTSWQWLNPLPQGNSLIAVQSINSSTVIAAGTSGTVIRSTNGGITWTVQYHVGGSYALSGISFIDTNTGTVVGDDPQGVGVILRTTNGGITWTSQSSEATVGFTDVFFTDANNGTVVGYDGTIFHTTDGGQSWRPKSSGTTEALYGVCFTDATTGTVVGFNGTILRTTNGGQSWSAQSSGTTYQLWAVSFTDANKGTVVGENGIILHTTNGGQSWTPQSSGTMSFLYGISFATADTGTAVGHAGTILHTTNGGLTWTSQSSGTSYGLDGVSFSDAKTGTAVGIRGTILRTTNGGQSWIRQSSGSTAWLSGVTFANSNTATAVGYLGTILRTSNGGTTWTPQSSGTNYQLQGVSFNNANTGTAVGYHGTIIRTTNGGATWISQLSGTANDLNGVSFADANTGTAVGMNGTVLRTTDGGESWTPQASGTTYALYGVSFTDTNMGTVVGYNPDPILPLAVVLRTTNGGENWTRQSIANTWTLRGVSFLDANSGTVVGSDGIMGTILRTTNGGGTWTAQSSGTDQELLSVSFVDANIGVAVGWGTILHTTDGGVTWVESNSPTTNLLLGVQLVRSGSGAVAIAVGDGGTILHASVSPLNGKVWTGSIDSSWNTPGNWSPLAVPTPGDSVVIPATSRNPVIDVLQQQVTVAALTVRSGAKLSITKALSRFVIEADVVVRGALELRPDAATSIVVGGSWLVQPETSSDLGFGAASSTVSLTGSGTFVSNFYNLVIDSPSRVTTAGNIIVDNQANVLSNVGLRKSDTLDITLNLPAALQGRGKIAGGTIQRRMQETQPFTWRFESDSTYVSYSAAFHKGTAAFPTAINMTSYPDSNPGVFSGWSPRGGKIDTLKKSIRIENVYPRGKWAIGVIRSRPSENPQAYEFVRRMYALSALGDTSALATLSFRYEQSEAAGLPENLLQLFYAETLTGVGTRGSGGTEQLPTVFALQQNYPNPFNPTTVLSYQLPVVSNVRLVVYDLLGREVSVPVNGRKEPGRYTVHFNAGGLASGVYFYRLEAKGQTSGGESYSRTGKMVVIR